MARVRIIIELPTMDAVRKARESFAATAALCREYGDDKTAESRGRDHPSYQDGSARHGAEGGALMAHLRYSIPGPGGSLGMCAVCGDTFLKEILLGEKVPMMSMTGIDRELPVHKACGDKIANLNGRWPEIRDKFPPGPLRDAMDESCNEGANQ